ALPEVGYSWLPGTCFCGLSLPLLMHVEFQKNGMPE
ncbi:MAG: hypothetical protein ACI8UZ_000818, partial [Akkermansiaceae bacterium]